ncbi:MAG TPA: divalent cation tolerance protein CutA [Gammaproteobacteria bacterium]|jgi:periplasmic divalent cation tolerance protein|nr:divalent cation tolerance protein CutA [Gammaproteobacteria bacterium]
MKMYYITVNRPEEAQAISQVLLERQLAVCTNWFPIMCAYRWQGEIKSGAEVVLIVKTKAGMRKALEEVVASQIDYTNYIAELAVDSVNVQFLNWLAQEVSVE